VATITHEAEAESMTQLNIEPAKDSMHGSNVDKSSKAQTQATLDTASLILIVDDNQTVARALAGRLRREGYETAVFHTGADALTYCAANSVSAAIVDIHLPDLSGLVLSQSLRQHMGPQNPIIVVSGDTSMENLNSLKHVGATYFFSKPVKSSQLLGQLKRLLP
jgi:DNA-binding response OmpR family regulator